MSYPVLIGSCALYQRKLLSTYKDIDLIVSDSIAKELTYSSKQKRDWLLYFENITCPIDLHLTTKSETNEIIFKECNQAYSDENMIMFDATEIKKKFKCELIDLGFCKALLPPLEILYVVLKSHIHRIINSTPHQNQNDGLWYQYVIKYRTIRDYIGYEKLDNVLYQGYLLDWKPITDDGSLEDLMRIIYQKRFVEINKTIGDTTVSMNKSEKEFFNDNVERFVDHDKLHEMVGMELRNDPQPIFVKYQTDKNSVNLNLEIFLQSSHIERINMLREEIIVLLLERKLIPELMMQKSELNAVVVDEQEKSKELFSVVANFITNLCGQHDYWLRRYCLDHVHLLIDKKFYDFDKIVKIAYEALGIKKITQKIMEDKKNIFEFAKKHEKRNNEILTHKLLRSSKKYSSSSNKPITHNMFGKEGMYTICLMNANELFRNSDDVILSFGAGLPGCIKQFIKYFGKDSCNIGTFDEATELLTIYSIDNNIGIHYQFDKLTVFSLSFETNYDDVTISSMCMTLDDEPISNFKNSYYKQKYYRSGCSYDPAEDDDYGYYNSDSDDEKRDAYYLSSTGSAPSYISELCEILSRKILRMGLYDDSDPY